MLCSERERTRQVELVRIIPLSIRTVHMATIEGTTSADTLLGKAENDSLYGNAGNDTLNGGNGNDFLYGYKGNDTLLGGAGDDLINGAGLAYSSTTGPQSFGDSEIDTLTGGSGKDTFQLWGGSGRAGVNVYCDSNSASDYALITDFNPNQDVIELTKVQGFGQTTAVNYSLGASPSGLPTGTGIFIDKNGQSELIAILQEVSPDTLSLNSSSFNYSS